MCLFWLSRSVTIVNDWLHSFGNAMSNARVQSCFSVPVAHFMLPGAERLNPALKERLLAWEKNEGKRSSAPTGVPKHEVYESDFSLFYREDPAVSALAQTCLNVLGELIMRLNQYSAEEMSNLRIFHHSWFHITRHGGYTALHNHPMASWSGVYCVSPGDNVGEYRNNGVLRLIDSRSNHTMYLDPGNAHLAAPYSPGDQALELQAGQLVLFPSWLQHEVLPYWGQSERITVAFNAWAREAWQSADEPHFRMRESERNAG